MSPADDESSREVFGLIKKLNIAPDNKRKPKALCKTCSSNSVCFTAFTYVLFMILSLIGQL